MSVSLHGLRMSCRKPPNQKPPKILCDVSDYKANCLLTMADTTAFESLAQKLPPEHRARFLAMSIQLRNLPPDDELVIALEALGFTALILKEIPAEISEVIGKMRSGLSDSQRDGLREDIESILTKSIDTPSYKDLRETIREMRVQHHKVRKETDMFTHALSNQRVWLRKRNAAMPSLLLGLSAGLLSGLLVIAAQISLKERGPSTMSEVAPKESPPVAQGLIDYFEADAPDFGGKVGMVLVAGEVLSAFKEGDRGVVVVKPLTANP